MASNQFLLYGANGYTGHLTARIARQYNLQPILAGRNESAIKPIAEQLQLPYRVFSLDEKDKLIAALKEVPVVLHTAGPFHRTSKQMIEGCIATGTHYLDINGNIEVFEFIKTYHAKAEAVGVMLMPGVGFDVVPTDCMALFLKKKLPTADHLQLAFASIGGSVSHGTAMTMSDRLGEKGAVRENGQIVEKPLGHKGMWVDFGKKRLFVMTIPWGDIATAYHTTGIPNIESFTGIKPSVYRILKVQGLFNWLLRTEWFRSLVRNRIGRRPAGPSDEMREKAKAFVWGKAWNKDGQAVQARTSGPEGYTLTAHSSLIITRKILERNLRTGYQTPAGCYGEDLVLEIPGVEREIL